MKRILALALVLVLLCSCFAACGKSKTVTTPSLTYLYNTSDAHKVIGENNVRLRGLICQDMDFYGIKIDHVANGEGAGSSPAKKISTEDSKVAVYLIPTNEELVIAQDTARIASAL